MKVALITCPIVLVGLMSAGCGGSNNKEPATPSQTTATSADTTQLDSTRQELTRTQHERDQARQELADQRALNEQQKRQIDTQIASMTERDSFEARAFEAVDKAEAKIHAMENDITHAKNQVEKKDLQAAQKDLREKKIQLEATARSMRSKAAADWDSFKTRMDTDIKSVEQAMTPAPKTK